MPFLVNDEGDLKVAAENKSDLASGSSKTWRYNGRYSSQNALARYVNTSPAQGAGEIMVTSSALGRYDLWIYM